MAATLQGAASGSGGTARGFSETRDFRIATLGNVDSGKSTLVGCLTRNIADDGRGSARAFVLRHQHEKSRGQSSSVAMTLLGFRDDEQVLPAAGPGRGTHNKDSFEVASKATHRLQLVE
jgi:GTPase